MKIHTSRDVQLALESGQPILALESTIIAHGMPFPDNLKFAQHGGKEIFYKTLLPLNILPLFSYIPLIFPIFSLNIFPMCSLFSQF